MDGWEDRLHSSFLGEHVLFSGLRLTSLGSFLSASFLTILICFAERALTFALAQHWTPIRYVRRSRLRTALWRMGMYWVVTLFRLLYMLVSMTFHVPLLLVIVTSLSVGQFAMEFYEQPHSPALRNSYRLHEPLLSPTSPVSDKHTIHTRPRARSSKPADIFIHPSNSNLARADAAAVELGLHGSTDRVRAQMQPGEATQWDHGQGRDVARQLLGGSSSSARSHTRPESAQKLFRVDDSGESDSDP
ncbi:hypothetical protein FA95DRAFT_1481624 [Auriscalpium vulgare]|uniref:Uncharacterized protein n=1 Tax=Auriscalpium vulgare TaxID=40419 RepID=A0ACB8SC38_9AGAM|nr:hypothetical protein FA95DRAFT_1481624 [Auriscalpium vulgare]